ncbi:hypothetical protein GCM10023191_073910 [Actinoallomurus oryzae]|uniref:Endonuclease/exonuclease/phosphatase domain-containing protein n=1 Tax=Actinoallomurus oryzae TaxID=502180 RepID=A0ABP8QUS1_9ACTN
MSAASCEFVAVTANLRYGGIDPQTLDDSSLCDTIEALGGLRADVVGLQEIDAGGNPHDIWRNFYRLANELGMHPVLGPSASFKTTTGNHVGILVRTSGGLRVKNQWPASGAAGTKVPWCCAEISVPGMSETLYVYSGHLHARSETERVRVIETLTSLITAGDQLAIWLADNNGYPREPAVSSEELKKLPRHLQLTRCIEGSEGDLTPNYTVCDTLVRAGLLDVAAVLPPSRREPSELCATGKGGARVDRVHAVERLAKTAKRYQQVETGSDHQACAVTFDLSRL